jgi:hypothetical protein
LAHFAIAETLFLGRRGSWIFLVPFLLVQGAGGRRDEGVSPAPRKNVIPAEAGTHDKPQHAFA